MKQARRQGSHAPKKEKPQKPPRQKRESKPLTLSVFFKKREPREKKHSARWKMALVVFLIAVLIIAAAAVMIGDPDARDYDRYMAQALESYRGSDYDNALSYLRRAESISHSDECLMLMADCYEAQDNLELALEVLRQLDTSNSAIAQRISDIERRRLQLLDADMVTVAGRQVPLGITSLVLDGLEVTDTELEAIKPLRWLSELSLADNALGDISALSELGGLITLNLSGNGIEDVSPLSSLTGLRTLYLDDNPIKDLRPLYALTGLSTLSITGLELEEGQLELLSAALPNCAIHSETAQEDIVDITIGGITFKSDVEVLDLSGKEIRDIGVLKGCQNLKQLDLSGNSLIDLSPLMNLPSLEQLNVSDNEISDLRPLIGMSTLRAVDASNNQVTDTATVGAMTGLTTLCLSDNPISDFSGLEKLRNLRTLSLKNTGLDDEGLQYMEKLNALMLLEVEDNPGLSGEAVDALWATLGNCEITHSKLVYSVEIGGIRVPGDTEELDLSGRSLSDLSGMTNLYNLITVDLSGNSISNIYIFKFTNSRTTIENLDLSSNQIEDITPIASMTALINLDLSNNMVNSVGPLMEQKGLRSLDLSGNPLTEEQLDALSNALPDCEISFG